MKRAGLFAILLLMLVAESQAQFSRYIIRFTDKSGSPFSIDNPRQFLSQRAIDRRNRYAIEINTSDIPVNPAYLDSILAAGNVTIINVSKWFNQVCIRTTDATALEKINTFPFVQSAAPIAQRQASAGSLINKILPPSRNTLPSVSHRPAGTAGYYSYGNSFPQVHLNNTDFLHDHGFRGQGMQMAIMDAGFLNYRTLPTFDSVRNNNQVLGTWDFVANKESVNEENAHGMFCFSTIAANLPGTFTGTAPGTSFYLYRTEDAASEFPIEEQNFAAAAERADSAGVDIFSVSLGYYDFDNNLFNYSYADMNGATTLIARAVNMASQKGILAVVAAGNEGNNAWRFIASPGDADEALTVGAVGTNRAVGGFSSYGPASDGQIKPDVAAVGVGTVIASANNGQPTNGNGTSFATPIMAGVTTCLWQAFPEESNNEIKQALRESADRYNTPNDRTGYGIPDAKKAFVNLVKKRFVKQAAVENNCQASLSWTVKIAPEMNILVERRLDSEPQYSVIDTLNTATAFSRQNFTFTEDLTFAEAGATIYYRLKMEIGTDTSFYLDSLSLLQTQTCIAPGVKGITIAPNPVKDNLLVKIEKYDPAKLSVTIHAMSGQQVYQLNDQQINGSLTLNIPVNKLSSGVYAVTVWLDGKKAAVKRVVKE